MAQACQPGPGRGLCEAEANPAWAAVPFPTGVFQVAEKLEKKTCALCPEGLDYSVLYFAQAENVAAHENCLLYSSALVECDDHEPFNLDRNFDVESVKKEIHRGKKLKCTFCGKRGATVGCDKKKCTKNYHFFCAKSDHAFLHIDEARGIYKVFCQQHAPGFPVVTQIGDDSAPNNNISGMKKKRGKKKHLSTGIRELQPEAVALIRHMKEEPGRHTDTIVKVAFLKKCKEAGLLNDLFEEILDKLHLIQERLVNETTSEADYEEIGTSLLDCRLFEDTFVNFQAAIENKIHQSEERQQQLKEEIELLQDLKQNLYLLQENKGLRSGCTSVSSLSA
ncbi:PHD finger protein 11 isoform X4 [Loxodonta africana]|uniref:PHD finger protein 11 isoform X4 n=1 Tax=Loxodonta africana TaxID=9785 RepID=UPI0030D3A37F